MKQEQNRVEATWAVMGLILLVATRHTAKWASSLGVDQGRHRHRQRRRVSVLVGSELHGIIAISEDKNRIIAVDKRRLTLDP